MNKKILLPPALLLTLMPAVKAHCPLCTMGAAAAAGGAVYLGVVPAAIGLFIGAFAIFIGAFVAKKIKKKFFKFQDASIIALSFVTTVLPLMPLIDKVQGFTISLFGDYGTIFNSTYVYSPFILGSVIGGAIAIASPWISESITKANGKQIIPYQGMILAFVLLAISATLIQIIY